MSINVRDILSLCNGTIYDKMWFFKTVTQYLCFVVMFSTTKEVINIVEFILDQNGELQREILGWRRSPTRLPHPSCSCPLWPFVSAPPARARKVTRSSSAVLLPNSVQLCRHAVYYIPTEHSLFPIN